MTTGFLHQVTLRQSRKNWDGKPAQQALIVFDSVDDAATVSNVSVQYESSERFVLKDLNFNLVRGSFTAIAGPVGSGKSTLLKLLLGELPTPQGSVSTSFTTSAYCSQQSWITCASIRDNILGESDMDKSWYHTVIDACALAPDIDRLVDGDQSRAGTQGMRLSGGQRTRIVRNSSG